MYTCKSAASNGQRWQTDHIISRKITVYHDTMQPPYIIINFLVQEPWLIFKGSFPETVKIKKYSGLQNISINAVFICFNVAFHFHKICHVTTNLQFLFTLLKYAVSIFISKTHSVWHGYRCGIRKTKMISLLPQNWFHDQCQKHLQIRRKRYCFCLLHVCFFAIYILLDPGCFDSTRFMTMTLSSAENQSERKRIQPHYHLMEVTYAKKVKHKTSHNAEKGGRKSFCYNWT